MDAKKTISKFIRPNLVLPIIFLVPPLTFLGLIMVLCGTLPTYSKVKKSLAKLEASGALEKAAEEMTSSNAKHLIKGKVIMTDNYVFCKGTGFVFTYDEIQWAYRQRFTRRLLLIPIKVNDSLYLATKTMKPREAAIMGKDKKEEIKAAILEIYNHNSKCLVGYSNENIAAYKAMTK